MRGLTTSGLRAVPLAATALAVTLAATGAAEAGCTRSIVNRSSATAMVSRDGGPWVTIPPHRSQAIRYAHPGTVEVALLCGAPGGAGPEQAVYRGSFSYTAAIDRCSFEIGDGFFERQLGPGFFAVQDTRPMTLNNPRQGDLIVGPAASERCPIPVREGLRARY